MAPPEPDLDPALSLDQRVLWALAYVGLLYYASLVAVLGGSRVQIIASFAAATIALVGMTWSLATRSPGIARRNITVLITCTWLLSLFAVSLFSPTDAELLASSAARLLRHGVDPYGVNLVRAWPAIAHLPARLYTDLMNGTHVTQFTYPAGQLGPLWVASHLSVTFAAVIADLTAWAVAGLVLYWELPRRYKAFAGLLLLAPPLMLSYTGTETDTLLIAPMIVALAELPRALRASEAIWRRFLSPVALGFAISVKPTPLVFVPLVLVVLYREAGRRPLARALGYGLVTVLAFLTVNAPFMVWGLSAWWRGTVATLTQGAVPAGLGVVSLFTSGLVTHLRVTFLALAGPLTLAAITLALVGWYPRLRRAWPVLAVLVFFVESRSYYSYFIYPFVAIAAYSLADIGHPRDPREADDPSIAVPSAPRRLWPERLGAVLAALAAAGCVGLAFAPVPLAVSAVQWGGRQGDLSRVEVVLANRSDRAQHVAVRALSLDPNANDPWLTTATGHTTLDVPAHQSLTVTLYATWPRVALDRPWVLEATTASVAILSTPYRSPRTSALTDHPRPSSS